jgi:hypothetical protein
MRATGIEVPIVRAAQAATGNAQAAAQELEERDRSDCTLGDGLEACKMSAASSEAV